MTFKVKQKKPERKTKVGDLYVHNNSIFKVMKITKTKKGKLLKLRPL